MASREVWGNYADPYYHDVHGPQFLRGFGLGDSDDVTHPKLHNLLRFKKTAEGANYELHDKPHRAWGPVVHSEAFDPREIWDDVAGGAYKHKNASAHFSPRTRALLHVPHIAADSLEEEGHHELANMLRNAEMVHTYHGRDAEYPDALFMHNGKPHLVVRGNGKTRYHFVGA